ncbi:hypothetical protein BVC80_3011g1 [Macleaya cordata]|uniref:Retrotransposon gag domain-containing protein n=1 Tax=Macleaya cordata TaxID=56857 RepID=A0A200Q447_MACCD|nr:hypothetical protein BVC80_3011g1 [Macleaya cordata]
MADSQASSSTTDHSSTSINLPPPSNVSSLLSNKLTSTNYLFLRSQFIPLLRSYELLGFVDGSNLCPPKFIKDSTTDALILNPEFIRWQKQDQLLLSWLLSSLTEETHSQVLDPQTSYEVWQELARSYASQSRARISNLRNELQNLRKGSDSIQQYFNRAKRIAHQLAQASKPLDDDDLALNILAGLPLDYSPFKASMSSRMEPLSSSDLLGSLLTEEMRLHQESQSELLNAAAHYVNTPGNYRSGNFSNFSSQTQNFGRGSRGRGIQHYCFRF